MTVTDRYTRWLLALALALRVNKELGQYPSAPADVLVDPERTA